MNECDDAKVDWRFTAFTAAVCVAAFLGLVWFCASMESKTYNRLTGAHTTAWDAVWADLDVIGTAK